MIFFTFWPPPLCSSLFSPSTIFIDDLNSLTISTLILFLFFFFKPFFPKGTLSSEIHQLQCRLPILHSFFFLVLVLGDYFQTLNPYTWILFVRVALLFLRLNWWQSMLVLAVLVLSKSAEHLLWKEYKDIKPIRESIGWNLS